MYSNRLFNHNVLLLPVCIPLITVGELHVHAVSAQEGLAVQRRVDVGRVWDGFTHQDSTGERGLFEAQHSRRTAVVHLQVSGAVQHLEGGGGGEMLRTVQMKLEDTGRVMSLTFMVNSQH